MKSSYSNSNLKVFLEFTLLNVVNISNLLSFFESNGSFHKNYIVKIPKRIHAYYYIFS